MSPVAKLTKWNVTLGVLTLGLHFQMLRTSTAFVSAEMVRVHARVGPLHRQGKSKAMRVVQLPADSQAPVSMLTHIPRPNQTLAFRDDSFLELLSQEITKATSIPAFAVCARTLSHLYVSSPSRSVNRSSHSIGW